ncbi:MAG: RDD family protein [Rhodoblastus sp.]|nr:MAG: RDD family protein [Rhodoblastus sp.]
MASGGRALLNAPYGAWRCETIAASGSETARAVGPKICRRSLLGHVFASVATAGAGGGQERRWEGPVDAAGRPVAPFDLGWALAPVFALVRLWFEAFGMRTPGRAAFGQRLIAQAGGAPDARALLRRYAALIGPFLLIAAIAATTIRVAPGWRAARRPRRRSRCRASTARRRSPCCGTPTIS